MAVNGVEIKVGQVWKTRGGAQAHVESCDRHPEFPWNLDVESCEDVMARSCDENGRIWGDGGEDSDGDLMFLVSDPDVKPERRRQQEPNSPMRRQDDMIPVPETVPDLAASPADFAASVPGMLDEGGGEPIPLMQPRSTNFLGGIKVAEGEPLRKLLDGAMSFIDPRKSALDVQIGGDHYRSMAIQPVTYIESNGLDFLAGNVVKYVSRHKNKNGAADVRKAIHYCQLILELQYGEKQ